MTCTKKVRALLKSPLAFFRRYERLLGRAMPEGEMMTEELAKFLAEGRKLRQEMRKHGYFLIVEDEPDAAILLQSIVQGKAAKFRSSTNADEAIALIKENSADIRCVVIDLHVPDTTGRGGIRLVEYLEEKCTGIPYVVHSNDRKQAEKIMREYPRASVLVKGAQFIEIVSMLGLSNENESENKN